MSDEREKPQILSATDLIHLNPHGRLSLLGRDAFLSRRDALRRLLGSAALVLVPPTLAGCESGEGDPQGACASDGGCACQADEGAGCPSDGACPCQTDGTDAPVVVEMVDPLDGATDVSPAAVIHIRFSEPVNWRETHYEFTPAPSVTCRWTFDDETGGTMTGFRLSQCERFVDTENRPADLAPQTQYRVRVHGTAASGKTFDATFGFTTGGAACPCETHVSCPCQSDCPTHSGCSCESYCTGNCNQGCPMYSVCTAYV